MRTISQIQLWPHLNDGAWLLGAARELSQGQEAAEQEGRGAVWARELARDDIGEAPMTVAKATAMACAIAWMSILTSRPPTARSRGAPIAAAPTARRRHGKRVGCARKRA